MSKPTPSQQRIQEIDRQIDQLRSAVEQVQGRETEVYTRIVGYHRAVASWNKGKKEEYFQRQTFALNDVESPTHPEIPGQTAIASSPNVSTGFSAGELHSYLFFHNCYCRNCPPVQHYLEQLELKGERVDTSAEDGLRLAKSYQVYSTPTVIFLNRHAQVVTTVHNLGELQGLGLSRKSALASV